MMDEELMKFDLPQNKSSIIKVIGVGGGGGNAVNHMFRQGITDVDFLICNTDAQALACSDIPIKIQLGESLTQGLGAGNNPDQGKQAAIESLDKIEEVLSHNTKMVFITAGMGGGTGTGAAPVIASAAKDMGILTVGIVTLPFRYEGKRRINQAIEGLSQMKEHVDALLVINNEKLREIHGNLPISQAFSNADNVLTVAAKSIAEIITVHGSVNVDFADVKTVMLNSGVALMGSATASGESRAMLAIEDALNSPLLNNNDIKGAKNILLNISSGPDDEVRMDEIGQITDYVQEAAGLNADIIWGNTLDESLGDKISITIIATGFGNDSIPELASRESANKKTVNLAENDTPIVNRSVTTPENEVPFEVITKPGFDEPFSEPNTNDNIERFDLFSDNSEKHDSTQEQVSNQVITSTNTDDSLQVKKVKRPEISYRNESDIEKLENEPAFKRKKIQLDDIEEVETNDNEISRYTLSSDEDGKTGLSENNPYLFDFNDID